jgi:hypothetical protein
MPRLGAVVRAPDRNFAPLVCLTAALAVGAAVAAGHEVVTLALLAASLYAVLFFVSPPAALLAYVASRPLVDGFVLVDVGPGTVGQIWGAGLLIVVGVFLLQTNMGRNVPMPVLALIGLYAVFAARGDTEVGLQYGLKLALWLLLIVAVERIARTRDGQLMCFRAGYALAAGTAVLIGVLVALNKYGAAYYESFGQAQETEQSPQPLAFLALFCISFPLIALFQRWSTTLSLTLVTVLTIEVVISYVRTALIGLVPIVLAYLFVAVRRGRPTAFALAAAFTVTALVVQERLAERFADLSLLGSGESSGAGSNRVAIWTSVWEATTSSVQTVVAGAGAGASHAASDEAIGHYVDAHNDFLEFFATGGVFLVAAYIGLVVWAIAGVWRIYRDPAHSARARGAAAITFGTIAAFLATSMFASISFYAALVVFAVLLGLIRGMASTPGRTCFDPQPGEGVRVRAW